MRLILLLIGLGCLETALAQIAGVAPQNANRPGGISFVTRRVPTSGVSATAAGFFAAGGVTGIQPVGGVGTVTASAPVLARQAAPGPTLADAKVQAALRQLAARGDKAAAEVLRQTRPAARR